MIRAHPTALIALTVVAVALVAVSVVTPASAAPTRQANTRVSMTVDAGLNSYIKDRTWIPLRVTLVNTGDPIEGEVVVTDARTDLTQRFAQPVTLSRGARRTVTLFVPPLGDAFEVRLVAGDTIIASTAPVVRQLQPTDRLTLITSDPPDGFNFIGDVRTPTGSTTALALLRLDQLPDRTAALDSADVIVLNNIDTGALTRAQRNAIVQWVAAGGHLILSGGPTSQLVLAGFQDIAPAEAGQALTNATVTELSGLATPLALDGTDLRITETLAVPRLTPVQPNVRVLAASNETPLILRRDYGRGLIDQLAFDPALAPVRDWPGRAALFAWLMGGRVSLSNDIGNVKDSLDAQFAAGALAAASPPSALVVGGFFALYVIVIGPLNFLVLQRFRRQALAWFTIPAIVIGFTLLGVLTGFRLRGNNPQVHRLTATIGDANGEQARMFGVYGLYAPRRVEVDVAFERALTRLLGVERNPDLPEQVVDVITGDPTRIRNVPLSNSELRTAFGLDGNTLGPLNSSLTFVAGSANTAASLSGDIRNDTGFPLQGCALVIGRDYQAIGNLNIGERKTVKINMVSAHAQSLISLRNINNIRERFMSGRDFAYSTVVRTPKSSSSSAARANSTSSLDRFPFEQNGPPVTDALVNWQTFTDPLPQDAAVGLVATVFGTESIGSGAYVGCWEMRDTSRTEIDTAEYTDQALRIWRVPVQSHLVQAGESLPADVFAWSILSTSASSELNDSGLLLEPGTHMLALTPWFEMRLGRQTPLVALNLTFDTSSSFQIGLEQTRISLYNWETREYVEVVANADELARQNVAAGPYVSPAGQIIARIEVGEESINLSRVATTVEMGK
jgi:hypothetical protein